MKCDIFQVDLHWPASDSQCGLAEVQGRLRKSSFSRRLFKMSWSAGDVKRVSRYINCKPDDRNSIFTCTRRRLVFGHQPHKFLLFKYCLNADLFSILQPPICTALSHHAGPPWWMQGSLHINYTLKLPPFATPTA